jgi:hypothetical protein
MTADYEYERNDVAENAETVAEWRVKYPESDWSDWVEWTSGAAETDAILKLMVAEGRRNWVEWTSGAAETDAILKLMVAEGRRPGGPDHQLWRTKWGNTENEFRVVRRG